MWQNHVPVANVCELANQSLSAAAAAGGVIMDLEELLFLNIYEKTSQRQKLRPSPQTPISPLQTAMSPALTDVHP